MKNQQKNTVDVIDWNRHAPLATAGTQSLAADWQF